MAEDGPTAPHPPDEKAKMSKSTHLEFADAVHQFVQGNPVTGLFLMRLYSTFSGIVSRCRRVFRYPHAYIAFDARLIGMSRIELGRNVVIGSGSWLNVNDRVPKSIALSIGDNSFIGIHNLINVGNAVTLGPYCLTAKNCSFIGSTHRYSDPMTAYLTTGVTLNSDIYVGANCFFGYGAQVIGSIRIGHGCVIGSGAVIRKDIAPFSLVVGNPGTVIKRFDFGKKEWVRWPTEDLVEGPPEDEYVAELRRRHGFLIQPLSVAASSFGDLI